MKRKSPGRRALLLALLAIGPLSIGCEAILDFDRTQLQPVPDAGLDEDTGSSTATDAKAKDAKQSGDDDDDDDKPDAKAKDSGAKDAGEDADGGDSGQP